ncbi:MAG: hypothetical protein GY711_10425 [bacterium]|nr:hypothetical protein [bacterium]
MLRTAAPLSALFACLLAGSAIQDHVAPNRLDVIDFEGLPAGTIVNEVTARFGLGPIRVLGVNPRLASNAAVVFDSAHPTGGDDDLGTPHEDFGGPGIGAGGAAGSDYENHLPHGSVLVVADDLTDSNGDGRVDDPGDTNDPGAMVVLDFSSVGPVTLHAITVVDVESANARVDALDAGGILLASKALPVTGNNGVARVDLEHVAGVTSMEVHLGGSAAIDDVVIERLLPGRVTGFVWDDQDADGLQGLGELGIPGVTLALAGPFAATLEITTDEHGCYDSGPLAPGGYTLTVETPPGAVPSPCDVGGDDTIDSDCSPVALEIADGAPAADVDFGFIFAGSDGSIGDLIFNDLNGDNVQDEGDVGVAGAVLSLHDVEGNLLATAISDDDGNYQFTGLPDGVYLVSVDVSAAAGAEALGAVICNVGDEELDSECGPVCVVLQSNFSGGSQNATIDFGFGDCGDCSGKADALSLRYLGSSTALVEVIEKDGVLVFADVLEPDDAFSFFGADHMLTFGPWIDIYIDGVETERIHTSCSVPIEPGMVFGDFLILAGTSRNGGVLCPE